VLNFARTATCDTVLLGQPIAQGEKVVLTYQSANRDATAFDAPPTSSGWTAKRTRTSRSVSARISASAPTSPASRCAWCSRSWRAVSPDIRMAEGAVPVYTGTNTLVHGVESIPVTYR
jgi:hypothetical protein